MNLHAPSRLAAVDPRPQPTDVVEPDEVEAGLRPAVAGAGPQSVPWLVIGGSVLMGLLVLLFLSTRRSQTELEPVAPEAPPTASTGVSAAPAPPQDLLLAEAASRNPLYAPAGAQPIPANGAAIPPAPANTVGPIGPIPTYAPAPSYGPIGSFAPMPGFSTAPASGVASPAAAITAVQRRSAPALIVDLARGPAVAPGAAGQGTAPGLGPADGPSPAAGQTAGGAAGALAALASRAPGAGGLSGDEQFAQRVGAAEAESARATMLRNPGLTVPQGAMIPAVLETALNSDLPGFARAVVSRDVRSFDGRTVLIPRGSRIIGQYRSGVAVGQSRAFVIWSRILRPDGASVQIASSGADPLGRAGLEGKVDRRFFQRFGGSALMSVISAGASAIAGRPSTQVVIGSSQQASGLASAVSPRDIPPTIRVQQGSPIQVFVARDLDFSAVGAAGR